MTAHGWMYRSYTVYNRHHHQFLIITLVFSFMMYFF